MSKLVWLKKRFPAPGAGWGPDQDRFALVEESAVKHRLNRGMVMVSVDVSSDAQDVYVRLPKQFAATFGDYTETSPPTALPQEVHLLAGDKAGLDGLFSEGEQDG